MASLWVDLRSTNPLSPSRAFPWIKKMANAVESSTWRCPCLETRPRNLSGNSIAKTERLSSARMIDARLGKGICGGPLSPFQKMNLRPPLSPRAVAVGTAMP